MSNVHIRGLLDRPSPRSLGMLGLVVSRDDAAALGTEGVVGPWDGAIDPDELDGLAAGGHAFKVQGTPLIVRTDATLAALWAGKEFLEQAERVGLRLPPFPTPTTRDVDWGRYWIAPARHVWRVIDAWIVQAFRRVANAPDDQLASLITWASPDRDEARAAVWLTTSHSRRNRELQWWSKLAADRGSTGQTPDVLEARFKKLITAAQSRPSEIVGFCAPAKGGDNDIAEQLARVRKIRRVSFGAWLKRSALLRGEPSDRTHLQKMGRDMLEGRGALAFCLEVLPEFGIPSAEFVIDGIRHMEVLESLRCLVGPDRFKLASVNRSAALRRRLLMEEEHLTPDVVDLVLNDSTEHEIPRIQGEAIFRLDAEGGTAHAGEELLELLRR